MAEYSSHLRANELLDDAKRAVAMATVGYDAGSKICAQTATAFERLLREIDPGLLEAIGPRPLEGDPLALWSLVEQDQTLDQHRRRVDALGERWECFQQLRFDGERAPQGVLILPAARLMDPQARDDLVRGLSEVSRRLACLTILFLDDQRRLLEPGTSLQDLHPWIEPLRILARPAWLSVHLVSLSLESGDLLRLEELSETVATALCADLVLISPEAPRVLTHRPSKPGVSLSTFGLRMLRFDCQRVADRFAPRLTRELLARTVLSEPTSALPRADQLLESASDVVVEAFPETGEFNAKPLVESGRRAGAFSAECPALAGPDFNLTVDLGAMAKGARMGRLPRSRWAEYLHQWDFFVRQSRLPRLLKRVREGVRSTAERQGKRIPEALSREFAEPDGARAAVRLCDAVADRVHYRYTLNVRRGGSRPLRDSLGELDRALARIPHWFSLVARAAVLLAVQVLLLLAVAGMDASVLRTVLLVALAVVAATTAVVSLAPWWRAAAHAQSVRDRALKDTETRAQLAFGVQMQAELDAVREARMAALDRYRKVLVAVGEAVRNLDAQTDDAPPPGESRFVFALPERWREEEFYECLVGNELAGHLGVDLVSRFSAHVEQGARQALAGTIAASVVADRVVQFAREELLHRLRTRHQLWMLLRRELSKGQPDTEIVQRAVEPLGEKLPCIFLQGTVVREAALDGGRLNKYFVAPPVLCQFEPLVFRAEPLRSALDNAVLVLSRVELLSLERGKDEPETKQQRTRSAERRMRGRRPDEGPSDAPDELT